MMINWRRRKTHATICESLETSWRHIGQHDKNFDDHDDVIKWKHFPVTGEFPSQRPVTRSFDVFFDLRLNKRLNKHFGQHDKNFYDHDGVIKWKHFPVTGEFPSQRPVTRSFDVFFVLRLNKRLNKHFGQHDKNFYDHDDVIKWKHFPVTGEFPSQRPVTRSFDVFFDLRLNKRLNKHFGQHDKNFYDHDGVIKWKYFPVTGEFPSQRPVTRSFDVFFDLRLNKRLNKHFGQHDKNFYDHDDVIKWKHFPVTGEFSSQRPVTRSFDVFFDLRLNKRLNKHFGQHDKNFYDHDGVIKWKHFPVTGEFPSQRPVTRSFDVFFDLRLNKRLNKHFGQHDKNFYDHDDVIKWKHFPVTGEFPSQRPVTRSFDVFFDLRLNNRLNKHLRRWRFETPSHPSWRHCIDKRIF